MATTTSDTAFPFFEENNYLGWLFQFKAHLRRFDADLVLDIPIPKDVDAAGVPIPMTNAERRQFERDLEEYKSKDKIAFPELVKACYKNPKTKNLCETGGFKTANEIMVRLQKRFHTVSDTTKAAHLLRYSSLSQLEGETGADFVDREQKAYLALQEMGVNVDDSLRLTKFIQQDTTNSKHKALAHTIFTTPNMTLNRATSLFETYLPGDTSTAAPSVNAIFCRYCKKNGHDIQACTKRPKNDRKGKAPNKRPAQKNQPLKNSPKKKSRFPCGICDAFGHPTYQCPRKAEVKQCLGSAEKKVKWGDDEQLTSDFEN